ncbi:CidA/LrgA family protein [Pseudoalteromonas luteoviolacea]|uniref:LrgA n=2 Tax=Pseudoalteromonas luteoviolacea TaxID=43657 RepID=A0A0F6AFW0_9GAMM|nr:hypothetical protein S4054249_15710 [Pseudoalteromonas luteoviolacea]AOT14113.1 hypothetical protein S40542_15680 [Pseudoalteromonas luteoviolacea]AOT19029.1 hypothetical protein S4054_15685 [Pseudoalteromonas luteoviolacea]KKE85095.1 hypothetical protein N479_06570 [Pseudoalteromonas luteoviolacea S4054]KZN70213.1 hypothetical protein N481_01680 [Pseudoalteromonas luteoviolacea S4047-1]
MLIALTGLNFPAPLVGLIVLFLLLQFNIVSPEKLAPTSQILIKYLPLFFIPVGVGFISYISILTEHILLIGLLLTLLPLILLFCVGKLAAKGKYRD